MNAGDNFWLEIGEKLVLPLLGLLVTLIGVLAPYIFEKGERIKSSPKWAKALSGWLTRWRLWIVGLAASLFVIFLILQLAPGSGGQLISDTLDLEDDTVAEDKESFGSGIKRKDVNKITFLSKLPQKEEEGIDVSEDLDGSVLAWFDEVTTGGYNLIIAANGKIRAPEDCSRLFNGYSNVKSIDLSALDTSGVTDMRSMFDNCSKLERLTFPARFDTSSVTDMYCMFNKCYKLEELVLPQGFDTSSVTDMRWMFSECSELGRLVLPERFDTSNVTSMRSMFNNCCKLEGLALPQGFDTSSVTDMYCMFNKCYKLEELVLPQGFDTSSVTDMRWMFSECSELGRLVLPERFDTSSVTDMRSMFNMCCKLEELDVSEFDTSSVTDMRAMFNMCCKLEELDVSEFDTSSVTDMKYMFYDCSGLKSLNLANEEPDTSWDISSLETNEGIFYNVKESAITFPSVEVENVLLCKEGGTLKSDKVKWSEDLSSVKSFSSNYGRSEVTKIVTLPYLPDDKEEVESIDVSENEDGSVKAWFEEVDGKLQLTIASDGMIVAPQNCSGLFAEYENATSIDLSGLDTSDVWNMYGMFNDCSRLEDLVISRFDTSKVMSMGWMFNHCDKLKEVVFPAGFDTSNVTDMQRMFQYCSKLERIDVSGFDTSRVEDMSYMFGRCDDLRTLDLRSWKLDALKTTERMFAGAGKSLTVRYSESESWANLIKSDDLGGSPMFEKS